METNLTTIRRTAGEIISQFMNVPILSGLLAVVFYLRLSPVEPNRLTGLVWSLVFLSLVPALSYFFYIPLKHDTRETTVHRQRVASFVFMILSYPLGWLVLSIVKAPLIFRATLEIYTFVTVGLVILNLIMHYKASGHAAGVSGPVFSLIYLYGAVAAPLLMLLPLVTWARMAAKGHNFWQTMVGSILSMLISMAVLHYYGFLPFSGLIW